MTMTAFRHRTIFFTFDRLACSQDSTHLPSRRRLLSTLEESAFWKEWQVPEATEEASSRTHSPSWQLMWSTTRVQVPRNTAFNQIASRKVVGGSPLHTLVELAADVVDDEEGAHVRGDGVVAAAGNDAHTLGGRRLVVLVHDAPDVPRLACVQGVRGLRLRRHRPESIVIDVQRLACSVGAQPVAQRGCPPS